MRFTRLDGFHMRLQFSFSLFDDVVNSLAIRINATDSSQSACRAQLGFFCNPLHSFLLLVENVKTSSTTCMANQISSVRDVLRIIVSPSSPDLLCPSGGISLEQ